jgi:hypothetical protein
MRAHAVIAHPRRAHSAYVCARRPGTYLVHFDPLTGTPIAHADADEAHRFEGHAVVDPARQRVLTTESELEQGQGRIGVYDADTLQRLDEWPSYGIGPHELAWLGPDVLAVANGGILTLPETGRIKRNLDTMEPSLVLLETHAGHQLAAFTLMNRQLSIRHLAVTSNGVLGAALQNEGQVDAPLLALLHAGRFSTVETTTAITTRIGNYAAAVAACSDLFAVTCTRADCVAVWNTHGQYCGAVAMRKPAGIVAPGDTWLVTNEFGELWQIDAERLQVAARHTRPTLIWDNHLAAVASHRGL